MTESKIEWTDRSDALFERIRPGFSGHEMMNDAIRKLLMRNTPCLFQPCPEISIALGTVAGRARRNDVSLIRTSSIYHWNHMIPRCRWRRAISASPGELFCNHLLHVDANRADPAFARMCVLSTRGSESRIISISIASPLPRVFATEAGSPDIRRRKPFLAPATKSEARGSIKRGNRLDMAFARGIVLARFANRRETVSSGPVRSKLVAKNPPPTFAAMLQSALDLALIITKRNTDLFGGNFCRAFRGLGHGAE